MKILLWSVILSPGLAVQPSSSTMNYLESSIHPWTLSTCHVFKRRIYTVSPRNCTEMGLERFNTLCWVNLPISLMRKVLKDGSYPVPLKMQLDEISAKARWRVTKKVTCLHGKRVLQQAPLYSLSLRGVLEKFGICRTKNYNTQKQNNKKFPGWVRTGYFQCLTFGLFKITNISTPLVPCRSLFPRLSNCWDRLKQRRAFFPGSMPILPRTPHRHFDISIQRLWDI